MPINIVAFADVHGTQYVNLLISSLRRVDVSNVDVIVMAGDVVDKGRVEHMNIVLSILQRFFPHIYTKPIIIAVFGNEEYMNTETKYYSMYPRIIWLNNNYKIVELNNSKICFIGSRGVLKKPTLWQQRNIKGIEDFYAKNLELIVKMIEFCKQNSYYTILITHYASSYLTIRGEDPSIYPYLGYPIIESIDSKPNLAIHGHAHNSSVTEAVVDGVNVFNVSIPAKKGVSTIII